MRRYSFWPYLAFVAFTLSSRSACAGVETAVEAMLEKDDATQVRKLTLEDCMRLAMTQNKDVLTAWHGIRETQLGDRLVTRSRLYPQLGFIWDYQKNHFGERENTRPESDVDNSAVFQFSQRLFEFGKDIGSEVALRRAERNALYNFENTSRETLSSVRETFYTILLRQEQLVARRNLLGGFKSDYERKRKRLELKEATIDPFDVLSAELNVLEEEANVNTLEAEIAVSVYVLQQLMGESIGAHIELVGAQDQTVFDIGAAVRTALENSADLAQTREEVAEQKRVLREVIWEYLPDVTFGAGYRREGDEAGISIDSVGSDTWAVDLVGDLNANKSDSRDDEFFRSGDTDYFVDLEVSVPIFEGFRRVGVYNQERERLRQAELQLGKAQEEIERNVRGRYADMMRAAKNVDIARQQASISERKLEIKERFKEEIPAMVSDQEYETFRNNFFRDQDRYFDQQINFVSVREQLRQVMGYFEEKPLDAMGDAAGDTT